jgi:hypothetical protein
MTAYQASYQAIGQLLAAGRNSTYFRQHSQRTLPAGAYISTYSRHQRRRHVLGVVELGRTSRGRLHAFYIRMPLLAEPTDFRPHGRFILRFVVMAITSALSWPVQIDLQVYPETGIFTRLQRSGGGSPGSSMAAPHHREKGKKPRSPDELSGLSPGSVYYSSHSLKDAQKEGGGHIDSFPLFSLFSLFSHSL